MVRTTYTHNEVVHLLFQFADQNAILDSKKGIQKTNEFMETKLKRTSKPRKMKKQEAIVALKQGKRLRHNTFSDNEWVQGLPTGKYEFEDTMRCNPELFWRDRQGQPWENGWSIVEVSKDEKQFSKVQVVTLLEELLEASPDMVITYPDGTTREIDRCKFNTWMDKHIQAIKSD